MEITKKREIKKRELELISKLYNDASEIYNGDDLYELIYPQMKKEFGKQIMEQFEMESLDKLIKKYNKVK
jgi:hypothetical protein